MTIEQLLTLKTVVQLGSFRAASNHLNKAQSALSYAIRTLEDELGFKLFDRSLYRPSLTPQGKFFYKNTESFLTQFTELESSARSIRLGYEPEFKIAISAVLPLPLIAGCLREFQRQFPKTELKIQQDILSTDEQLLEGNVDIAFGELFNDLSSLKKKCIAVVEMIPCCHKTHPLASLKGKAPPSDLQLHSQIVLSSTAKKQKHREAGVENKNNPLNVSDLSTKLQLLREGIGWGYMPKHLVADEIKKKNFVLTHQNIIKAPVYIAFNSHKPLGLCGKFIWNYFEKYK